MSIGVGSRANERTIALAAVDRQSERGGEEGQEGDNDSGREHHLCEVLRIEDLGTRDCWMLSDERDSQLKVGF